MKNLKYLRSERNLTQEDLGKMLGVSRQAVLNWENGITNPDWDMVMKIVEIFHVSLDFLFDIENPDPGVDYMVQKLRKIPAKDLRDFLKKY